MYVSSSSSDEPIAPAFFSIQDAQTLLIGKKVTLIKPKSLEWDERWKVVGICLSIFTFYIGATVFFLAGEKFSTLDHDKDSLHPFLKWSDTNSTLYMIECPNSSKTCEDPFYSRNGSIILHDRDVLVPNVSIGVISFMAVALIPTFLFFLTGKTYYFGINYFAKKKYQKRQIRNEQINKLLIQLSTIEIQNYLHLETPPKFIKKMANLDLLTEQELTSLSPLQLTAYNQVKELPFTSAYREQLLEVKVEDFEIEEIEISLDDEETRFNKITSFLKSEELYLDLDYLKLILDEATKFPCSKVDHQIVTYLIKKLNTLLERFGTRSLLNICLTYKLPSVKKGIDIKISLELPHFFSDDFLKTVELIKIYDLQYSFLELIKTLTISLEELSLDERFVTVLANLFYLNNKVMKNLFPAFQELLQLKPKLLKKLLEESTKLKCFKTLEAIYHFCKNIENSHITLANWNKPPTIALNISKEKESDAS